MKIRNGFVSNSSSSSFCIYGLCLDPSDFKHLLPNVMSELLIELNPDNDEDFEITDNLYDIFECKTFVDKIPDLDFWSPQDWDESYLGRGWATIKDNETGAEFKAHIKEVLSQIFDDELVQQCGYYAEAWYNG